MTNGDAHVNPSHFNPTPEQAQILNHPRDRHARVLAGPGTGKSATLVALVDQIVGTDPAPRIRLLTFTRAATAELGRKVSEHPAAATQRPSTIHSFALSVLLQNPGAGELPRPIRIADDLEERDIIRPSLALRAHVSGKKLDALIHEMSSNWESLTEMYDPRVTEEERHRFIGAWHEHRRIFGYTLLQELPYALRHALHNHPDLDGVTYDLLIVDEYQDLNACDLDVLRLIAQRGCSIIAAGDDDQSIYSWRMAAPQGIRRFVDDYPGAADYSMSVTQRCGSRIINWASSIIEGDPDRPHEKVRLTSAAGSPEGEIALLSFQNQAEEASGVATIVGRLVRVENLAPSEILILLRSDHNGSFSHPIKEHLGTLGVAYSDPDSLKRVLETDQNRRLLTLLRLVCNREDSLGWASLLHMTPGVGPAFQAHIYDCARNRRTTFGAALLAEFEAGFPLAPKGVAPRVEAVVRPLMTWLSDYAQPEEPDMGWGHWIIQEVENGNLPPPTPELKELLFAMDEVVESGRDLGRFLAQIRPLGKDRAFATSAGVRIMTLAGAKGLTARAAIIPAVEEGIIPRPQADLAEERRLLYVGMTRAKEFLYLTWSRRRTGPTARAGAPRVGVIRNFSTFLQGGQVESEDGPSYIAQKWRG